MSDRPQSTRLTRPAHPRRDLQQSPSPPEQIAFRETFLWRFYRPEVAAAFRLAGDGLFDLMNEAGEWGAADGAPLTYGELRAACDDLGHLVAYLEEVAGEPHASELDEVAASLATDAGRWAERLARLVADMLASLGAARDALDSQARDAGREPN